MPATRCTCIRTDNYLLIVADPDCPAKNIHAKKEEAA
jgi:hypothetical protein